MLKNMIIHNPMRKNVRQKLYGAHAYAIDLLTCIPIVNLVEILETLNAYIWRKGFMHILLMEVTYD